MKTLPFPSLSTRFRAFALLLPLAVLPACESPGLAGAAIGTGGALLAGGLLTGNANLAIAGGALAAGAGGALIAGGISQQQRAVAGANMGPPIDPQAGYIQGQPYGYSQPQSYYSQRDQYAAPRQQQYYGPRYQQPQAYIERERITVGPVDPYLAQQAGCYLEGRNHTGGASWRCPPHINPLSIQVRPGWGS